MIKRRDFIGFLGIATVGATSLKLSPSEAQTPLAPLPHMTPQDIDDVILAEGLNYQVLLKWKDEIASGKKFGTSCDFIAFTPLSGPDHGILWVNHEYISPLFTGDGGKRSQKNVDQERTEVGGSLVEIKCSKGKWSLVKNSQYNRRIDATTKIPFDWNEKIVDSNFAIGTMANCAGGKTPWGTILTCEENYDLFWGERKYQKERTPSYFQWEKFYPYPPEHYGWVVEINPKTGEAKKLISLGRCMHECAAVKQAKDGRIVAYTGDDTNDEHLYKFISSKPGTLSLGNLYVANLKQGKWISLKREDHDVLKKNFKSQTEIQIYLREAAKMVGATPLDRPEDIEFDPMTGDVFVALTNNKPKKNYHGSILKLVEKNRDPLSLEFSSETYIAGGEETGFACPDNMVFDKMGNLWFTTDMAGSEMNKGIYKKFKNNGLFVVIRQGKNKGKVIQVASAPVDAEFTGPCFSPDYKTLFLSVQHPGEQTKDLTKPTSKWPDGELPKSSVITIQGDLLDKMTNGKI